MWVKALDVKKIPSITFAKARGDTVFPCKAVQCTHLESWLIVESALNHPQELFPEHQCYGQTSLQEYFSTWLLRNLNYTKFNKKVISYIVKKKKHTHIHKVL